MTKKLIKSNPAGFSVIEAVLVLAIIGIVVGIGAYVYHQNKTKLVTPTSHAAGANTATSGSTTSSNNSGTTAAITQEVEQDAQTEGSVSSSNDSAATSATMSSNSAASNLGGAYNESTL